MKKLATLLFLLTVIHFNGYSQTEKYNLESQNLHKNVRKTIEHYYSYDKNSGGFVKKSVNIKRYNNEGYLVESYYLFNSTYSESTPTKRAYNYNNKGALLNTQNNSDVKGKYSTHDVYTYDKKNRITKKESIYTDGSKYYSEYKTDRKGRVINKKEYSKTNKLTAEINYKYKGSKRTEDRTSFSSTDGSISGNYVTIYDDDVKISYQSNNKYGNSTTSYNYDKKGNLKKSDYKGKTSSSTTYDYVYDKKDNWVKKHYKSGKYQYFYFREIYFKNDDITGSTDFDRTFINRHGNFDNVAVVPLIKKSFKKKNNSNTNVTYNSGMPSFSYKNWKYTFVNMKDKVSDISGKVNLNVTSGSNLSEGNTVKFKVDINGAETKYLTYKIKNYNYDSKTERHNWILKSTVNETSGTLCVFKKPLRKKGVDLVGLLLVGKENNQICFYLQ